MWPDGAIQSSPIFSEIVQKIAKTVFTWKWCFPKKSRKVIKYGLFLWEIFPQDLSKKPNVVTLYPEINSHWVPLNRVILTLFIVPNVGGRIRLGIGSGKKVGSMLNEFNSNDRIFWKENLVWKWDHFMNPPLNFHSKKVFYIFKVNLVYLYIKTYYRSSFHNDLAR